MMELTYFFILEDKYEIKMKFAVLLIKNINLVHTEAPRVRVWDLQIKKYTIVGCVRREKLLT